MVAAVLWVAYGYMVRTPHPGTPTTTAPISTTSVVVTAPQESGAPPSPQGQFIGATMCKGLGADFSPVQPTETFQPNDKLNCSVQYRDLREGQVVEARWLKDGDELKRSSYHAKKDESGGYISFSLRTTEPWPTGAYQVQLYFERQLVHTVNFRVAR